jgi:hypothetical protein
MVKVFLVRNLAPATYGVVDADELPEGSVVLHDRKYKTEDGVVLDVYATSLARQQMAQVALAQAKDPVWKNDPSYSWNRRPDRPGRAARRA